MQQRARGMQVVAIERLVDVGEIVAELAETERQVQQQDVPDQRQRHADRRQQVVHHHRSQHQRHHDGQPRPARRRAGVCIERMLRPDRRAPDGCRHK